MYGSQAITVVAQFGYAAVTSRLVGASGFGSYAIALAVAGLVSLLSAGGLAQSVSRMADLNVQRMRALLAYSVLLGSASAVFIWLTASFWADLWGDSAAVPVLQFLAFSALFAPISGIGTSLMRRQGSFRWLAGATVASNILGMCVGIIAVVNSPTAVSLAVSAVGSQFLVLIASLILTKRVMWGVAGLGHARHEVAFGGHLTAIKIAEYLIGNITKFSVSRWLGASYFGFWNRADMLATLPFQQVQTALLQVISPEFRHDIDRPDRAYRLWTDLLILVSWLVAPLSALAAVILPHVVPTLFGPGWDVSAALTLPLAISACLQTVSMVLSSAVETLGRFRWMWITSSVLIAIQVLGAVGIFIYRDMAAAMICLIGTQIIRHAMQVTLCGRHGYLDVPRLMRNYGAVFIYSSVLAATAFLVAVLLTSTPRNPTCFVLSGGLVCFVLFFTWFMRRRLPPLLIIQRYGLFATRAS